MNMSKIARSARQLANNAIRPDNWRLSSIVLRASLLCSLLGGCDAYSTSGGLSGDARGKMRGVLLEDLTWQEAEKALTKDTVVVIPLGAAAKEHGPHLKLKNDLLLAQYFEKRVRDAAEVVAAPALGYHYYPAFVEYPGSTTLRLETARDLTIDVIKSIAAHGPRRFYVLNTGVSTVRALAPAAEALARDGILMAFTNLKTAFGDAEKQVLKQQGGTHADECETSMMLVIAPETVDMAKAEKDYHENKPGRLTRDPNGPGTYSPSGIWGDATLATREKGEALVEALTGSMLRDIEALRRAPLPEPAAPAGTAPAGEPPAAPQTGAAPVGTAPAMPAAPQPRPSSPAAADPLGTRR
jgi:creatinine amidohydrolase